MYEYDLAKPQDQLSITNLPSNHLSTKLYIAKPRENPKTKSGSPEAKGFCIVQNVLTSCSHHP